MSEEEDYSRPTRQLTIDTRGDNNLVARVPEDMYEEIEKEAEELGMPKSATARYFIQLGRKLAPIYDPRRAGEGSTIDPDPGTAQELTPFHEYLPQSEDDAITADEFAEYISEYIYDICREDDLITIDGREVYLDAD
jgi:hypothetical protein